MVQTILTALAPLVVTLLLGFVAAWHHDFATKDALVLNRMVLLYAVPVALFVGTVGTPRSELVQDVAFAVAMCVAIIGMYTLVLLFFRFVLRFSLKESVLMALAASAPAAPFMGPAILGDLFGKASAISIAVAALVINLVVVPVTIFCLELGKTPLPSTTHHSGVLQKLLKTFKEPMVWAPLLAFALVLSDVKVSPVLAHGLSLLSQAAGGVAIFASGIILTAYKIKIDWIVSLLVLLKNVVQPALVLGGLLWVGYRGSVVAKAVLTAAIPTMPIVVALAVQYEVSEAKASSVLLLSVLGSIITIGVFIGVTHQLT